MTTTPVVTTTPAPPGTEDAAPVAVSIMFPDGPDGGWPADGADQPPDCFADLHLDQVVAAVTAGHREHRLEPFFHLPLTTTDAVAYRQEVFADAERPAVREVLEAFAAAMAAVRSAQGEAAAARHRLEARLRQLGAALVYCEAVTALTEGLARADPASRGLASVWDHLEPYQASPAFGSLTADAHRVHDGIASLRYCVLVRGARVVVSPYDGEDDVGEQVARAFERFRDGEEPSRARRARTGDGLDDVEAQVLERVAQVHPDPFAALASFCDDHRDVVDATLARFDREAAFYLAYLSYLTPLHQAGLEVCRPRVQTGPGLRAVGVYDLALATATALQGRPVVTNDVVLAPTERLLVLTGPNQGGKSTLARTLGQLHHLAALGCPVPGREVSLRLCDRVLTQFPREEDAGSLTSRLEEDLLHLHAIVDEASDASVVVLNEAFSSTTTVDALSLSHQVLERISARGALCVCVTFLDELAHHDEATVSLVGEVTSDAAAHPTLRFVRRPADGHAYAVSIAEKHGLTYDALKGRIRR